jgi:hypothetical protein
MTHRQHWKMEAGFWGVAAAWRDMGVGAAAAAAAGVTAAAAAAAGGVTAPVPGNSRRAAAPTMLQWNPAEWIWTSRPESLP